MKFKEIFTPYNTLNSQHNIKNIKLSTSNSFKKPIRYNKSIYKPMSVSKINKKKPMIKTNFCFNLPWIQPKNQAMSTMYNSNHSIKNSKFFNNTSSFDSLSLYNTIENFTQFKNDDNSETFEEYALTMNDLMNHYIYNSQSNYTKPLNMKPLSQQKYNNSSKQNLTISTTNNYSTPISYYLDELSKSGQNFYKENTKIIQKIMKYNKWKNNQSEAGIRCRYMDYKHPIDSLGLILRNKSIHDHILTSTINRELDHYSKKIYKIKLAHNNDKYKKNVKITTLMPKDLEKEILGEDDIVNNDGSGRKSIKTGNPRKSIMVAEYLGNLAQNTKSDEDNNKINSPQGFNMSKSSSSTKKPNQNSIILPNSNLLSLKTYMHSSSHKKSKIDYISTNNFELGYLPLLAKILKIPRCFPCAREEATLEIDKKGNEIFLFGGILSNVKENGIWKFNVGKLQWELIRGTNTPPEARAGHTAVMFKNRYVIFGGVNLLNNYFPDIDIFNIEARTWSYPSINSSVYLQMRKNHIAVLVNDSMFIYGGINYGSTFLNDSHILTMNNTGYQWTKANIMFGQAMPYIAYHSACLVMPTEVVTNNKFNIYKIPETNKRLINKIQEKGIYVFGGKISPSFLPTNSLLVIKIGMKPLEWTEPETKGKPPEPRYSSSINFFEQGNYVIIHGGKGIQNRVYSDSYILELHRMEWLRVEYAYETFETEVCKRYSHSAIISNKNLIIFGGINDKNFVGSDLLVINLDPKNSSFFGYNMSKNGHEKKEDKENN